MMRRRVVSTLCIVTAALAGASAGPGLAGGESAPPSGSERLRAIVRQVSEAQRRVESLEARFRQTKTSALLLEPAVSTGTFLYRAPDRVRWEYEKPDPMVVVFDGNVLTTWDPGSGRLDRVKVSARQGRFVRVLAGTQPLEGLLQYFRVTLAGAPGGGDRLVLEPVDAALRRKIRSVRLDIDSTLHLPVAVEYVEADGDTTLYEFSDVAVNAPVPEDAFSIRTEGGARVETWDTSGGGPAAR